MTERKVTREIGYFIHKDYEALRLDKVKPEDAFKIVQSDVEDEFGIKIRLGTVRYYAQQTFDKATETRRRYRQSERYREAQRRYRQSEKGKEATRRHYQEHRKEILEHQKTYCQSKKGREARKKARRKHYQKMTKPRNEEIGIVIDVFTGFDVELTPKQVWEKAGGYYPEISKDLDAYHKAGVLNKRKEGIEVFYKLNPDSPFHVIADGYFEEKEKELDKKFGRT